MLTNKQADEILARLETNTNRFGVRPTLEESRALVESLKEAMALLRETATAFHQVSCFGEDDHEPECVKARTTLADWDRTVESPDASKEHAPTLMGRVTKEQNAYPNAEGAEVVQVSRRKENS